MVNSVHAVYLEGPEVSIWEGAESLRSSHNSLVYEPTNGCRKYERMKEVRIGGYCYSSGKIIMSIGWIEERL